VSRNAFVAKTAVVDLLRQGRQLPGVVHVGVERARAAEQRQGQGRELHEGE
jgi:hypothetical protein